MRKIDVLIHVAHKILPPNLCEEFDRLLGRGSFERAESVIRNYLARSALSEDEQQSYLRVLNEVVGA
jgi:hypothetical protein